MRALSNLPPGCTVRDIDRAADDGREALSDAVYAALRKHIGDDGTDEVWAQLEVDVDESETAGDVERAIRRQFAAEDARCGDVLADVRPVALRILDGEGDDPAVPVCALGEAYCTRKDKHSHCAECGGTSHADGKCEGEWHDGDEPACFAGGLSEV